MIKRSVGSLLDQLMLSALNFGIAFALIQGVSKPDYGLYVQLAMFALLASSVTDALLGNAFNILNNRTTGEQPPHLLSDIYRLSMVIASVATLAGFLLSLWLSRDWSVWSDRLLLALVYASYLFVSLSREFKRVCLYLTERWQQALLMDAMFVLCSTLLLGALAWNRWLNVTYVFVVLGASSALSAWFSPGMMDEKASGQRVALLKLARTSWGLSGWALPGVIAGWGINNAYLFILSLTLGSSATAEANAAKLAITPLVLTLVAWYQVNRAAVARLAQSGEPMAFKAFFKKATLMMYAPFFLYVPALAIIYPWIEPLLLNKGYTHFEALIVLWIVYALISPLKFLGTSMLVGFEAFKPLLKLDMVSLALQVIAVYVLASYFGLGYVLFALIAADLLQMAFMWIYLLPRYISGNARQSTSN